MSVFPPYGIEVGDADVPTIPSTEGASFSSEGTVSPGLPSAISFALPDGYLGPFLTYRSFSASKATWTGSILFVASSADAPTLRIKSEQGPVVASPTPRSLSRVANIVFYRFDLTVPTRRGTGFVRFDYEIEYGSKVLGYSFHVAAADEKNWTWTHWSCAGFSTDVEPERRNQLGKFTLWADLLRAHKDTSTPPFVLNVGGGDQVYADAVMKLPLLQEWLELKGKDTRKDHPWTAEHEADVTRFYVDLYGKEYSHPIMREIVATIPMVCVADDHDIIDGFGSYPEYIQQSNVFRNLGRIALNFIALFQHQTTPALAESDGFFSASTTSTGVPAYNHIRAIGPHTLLAALDTRAERTPTQVFAPATRDLIFSRLSAQLTNETKHILVLTGVPLIYARLEMMDTAADVLGKVKASVNAFANTVQGFFGSIANKVGGSSEGVDGTFTNVKMAVGKTGLMSSILNRFGEVELQDDLMDHWTHKNHGYERTQLIYRFQQLAEQHRVRVTFVGGDVHVGGAGYLFTDGTNVTPFNDHRLMYQIISSAIINVPPPSVVAKIVNGIARSPVRIDGRTVEAMHPLFEDEGRILASRNWCAVRGLDAELGLRFEIRGEVAKEEESAKEGEVDVVEGVEIVPYAVVVPALA
ncbi:hypothetical protein BJ742DRAFT_832548 [Cladochytrium replicatum]|nr:hypothetical protein BJ742DRAFT_832548 [Cladochytrium replicatum]